MLIKDLISKKSQKTKKEVCDLKVFIVCAGSYSDKHICAVFENGQKANEYCQIYNNRRFYHFDSAYVLEYETKDNFLETKMAKFVYLYPFQIGINNFNNKLIQTEKILAENELAIDIYNDIYYDDDIEYICCILDEKDDEKGAKILQDKYNQKKANLFGIV